MSMMPELCSKCRRLKPREAGSFRIDPRSNRRRFVCDECGLGSGPRRFLSASTHRPSKLELEATRVLLDLGLPFIRQFRIGKSTYDFAIPKLRLIIEVDGPHGHSGPSRAARDRARESNAKVAGWEVGRAKIPDVAGKVDALARRRMAELGLLPG